MFWIYCALFSSFVSREYARFSMESVVDVLYEAAFPMAIKDLI